VFAQRKEEPSAPDGYLMPHSSYSFLMDRAGACLSYYPSAARKDYIVNDLRAKILAPA
jgi:cytochrome oxidase Cu insertion factor (SCO1/SenC/PrrC family)